VGKAKKAVLSISYGGLLFMEEESGAPDDEFLSEAEIQHGIEIKRIRPADQFALLLLGDSREAVQQAKALIIYGPRNKTGYVDIRARDIKFIMGKNGATRELLEALCDMKIQVEEIQEDSSMRRVVLRAAQDSQIEEGKRAVLSATYGGVLYANSGKVDEAMLREVERRAGVSIKLQHCTDKFALKVLILGDMKADVERGRKLVLEQVHFWHTPTNLERKAARKEKQKTEKKEHAKVAKKCRGLKQGDRIPKFGGSRDFKLN